MSEQPSYPDWWWLFDHKSIINMKNFQTNTHVHVHVAYTVNSYSSDMWRVHCTCVCEEQWWTSKWLLICSASKRRWNTSWPFLWSPPKCRWLRYIVIVLHKHFTIIATATQCKLCSRILPPYFGKHVKSKQKQNYCLFMNALQQSA